MAGETTKTTSLTNRDSGILSNSRVTSGRERVAMDTYQFAAATSLEAGDNLILNIPIPSNAIVVEIAHINDDCDTHACAPTLVVDMGIAAREQHTSVTSGTVTTHDKDAIIDADLFIDGNTAFRSATTEWTVAAAADATTWGPEDRLKPVWELLGYDNDTNTVYNLVFQSQAAAAALGTAADIAIRVKYIID